MTRKEFLAKLKALSPILKAKNAPLAIQEDNDALIEIIEKTDDHFFEMLANGTEKDMAAIERLYGMAATN
jgi:hypothetical protein